MDIFETRAKTPSASFKTPGDVVGGKILEISEPIQKKKFRKDELDYWSNGKPKMQVCITVQTDQRDPEIEDDDGRRGIWVLDAFRNTEGSILNAVTTAIRNAGAKTIEVGGTLNVRLAGFDPQSQNPDNPRKIYQARYTAPPAGGGMFGAEDEWGPEEEEQAAAQQQRNAQSRGGGVDFARLRQEQEAQQQAEAAGWADPAPQQAPPVGWQDQQREAVRQAAQQPAPGPAADEWPEDPAPASQPAQQAQAAPDGGVDPAKAAQIVAMVNLGLEDDAIASALGGVTAQQVAAFRA